MSWIEGLPASATIKAVENTLLLVIPREVLETRQANDASFAARLFKSFAQVVARRLRERVGALGEQLQARAPAADAARQLRDRLSEPLDAFKHAVHKADQAILTSGDGALQEATAAVAEPFRRLCLALYKEVHGDAPEPLHIAAEIGKQMQREILPYLLLTRIGERSYSKPRGYAGDYLTIDMLYDNQPSGTGRVGPVLDSVILNVPTVRAVRNRRSLVADAIREILGTAAGRIAHVTSLACGPARELFDVFERLSHRGSLSAALIDIDPEALAFVRERRDRAGLENQMNLYGANLVYLATGRTTLDLPPQDLVYSIGLIDYFNDKFVLNLLNYVHRLLRPGGKVILGNFHPRNPDRAWMDYLLDWKLIHRTEADMDRLYAASSFGQPCTRIQFEGENINLFAECVKE